MKYKYTKLMWCDGNNAMTIYATKEEDFISIIDASNHCDKLNKESAHCVRWEFEPTTQTGKE